MEKLKIAKSDLVNLPEIKYGSHLLEFLFEMGVYIPTGMGIMPLTFSEINAWEISTQTWLTSWEARMIRFLSESYVSQYNISKEPSTPAPFSKARESGDYRQNVVEGLKKLAQTFRKKKKNG